MNELAVKANTSSVHQTRTTIPRTQREFEWQEHASARRRALDHILYDPPAFDSVVQTAFAFLRPQPSECVLDLGSGEGKQTARLAKLGANTQMWWLSIYPTLICFKRVPVLSTWRTRASISCRQILCIYRSARDVSVGIRQSNFASSRSQCGAARSAAHLVAGGRAAFAEPLAHAPLLWLARRVTPQWRSQDERPLTFAETGRFARAFAHHEWQYKFLTAPLAYPVRIVNERLFHFVHGRLDRLDDWLMGKMPFLKRFAWYGIILVGSTEEPKCAKME